MVNTAADENEDIENLTCSGNCCFARSGNLLPCCKYQGECTACTGAYGAPLGGADVVIEVAGSEDSFQLAWQSARPNATVTVVALYDRPQILPLPVMYGKNLTFKTGGVDGCDVPSFFRL